MTHHDTQRWTSLKSDLNGEADLQADALAPGLHFFLWPWQYTVSLVKFVTIPDGTIGIVEACDGNALPDGRVIAKQVAGDNFQDARAFLTNGGERGVRMSIIPPGTWRINSVIFTITEAKMTVVDPGKVGVVEAVDSVPLPMGRVIAKPTEACLIASDAKKPQRDLRLFYAKDTNKRMIS